MVQVNTLHFQVNGVKWHRMSATQRKAHLKEISHALSIQLAHQSSLYRFVTFN